MNFTSEWCCLYKRTEYAGLVSELWECGSKPDTNLNDGKKIRDEIGVKFESYCDLSSVFEVVYMLIGTSVILCLWSWNRKAKHWIVGI